MRNNASPGFAAARSSGHPWLGYLRPVIPNLVKPPAAPTMGGVEREGQAQPAEEEDPERGGVMRSPARTLALWAQP